MTQTYEAEDFIARFQPADTPEDLIVLDWPFQVTSARAGIFTIKEDHTPGTICYDCTLNEDWYQWKQDWSIQLSIHEVTWDPSIRL